MNKKKTLKMAMALLMTNAALLGTVMGATTPGPGQGGAVIPAPVGPAAPTVSLENGTNTTVESRDDNGNKIYKVNVTGDLTGIKSITNADGKKVTLGGDAINVDNVKISGVAEGTADNDAATVGQLKNASNINVQDWKDKLGIKDCDSACDANIEDTLKDDIGDVGANAAAIAALKPLQYNPMEKTQIMAGVGHYKSKNAVALGLAMHPNENLLLHGGVSMAKHNSVMVNAGVTWRVSTKEQRDAKGILKDGPITAMYRMANELDTVRAENQELRNDVALVKSENQALRETVEVMKRQMAELFARRA